MATKKTKRKTVTKKSGARKTGQTPARVKPKRKVGVNKRKIQNAKKRKAKVAKKKAKKKSILKRITKGTTAESRRADRVRRPQRRKPETGGNAARHEILEFFGSEDMSSLTPKELAERKLVFLRAFANRGIVRDGCVAAGTSWGMYTRWRDKDEAFNEACQHAEMLAADRLEAEAHRRAYDGYDKPVIYQGAITDTYTEYSDSLMQTLMKGYKKDKYRDRTEHSGSVGRPMTLDAETKESVVSSILGMIENKPDPEGAA